MASTEPQSRRLMDEMKAKREKKRKARESDTSGLQGQGKVTGTSPEGLQKSKKKGDAELQKLRDKQKKRAG